MEIFLARKGIKVVSFKDNDQTLYKYAYTDNLVSNNVFIEFYEYENEDLNPTNYETGITVYLLHRKLFYNFSILFEREPLVPPLYVYRIILDLVEIVENTESHDLIECLQQSCMSFICSRDLLHNDEKKEFTERLDRKILHIKKLIDQSKIDGN